MTQDDAITEGHRLAHQTRRVHVAYRDLEQSTPRDDRWLVAQWPIALPLGVACWMCQVTDHHPDTVGG